MKVPKKRILRTADPSVNTRVSKGRKNNVMERMIREATVLRSDMNEENAKAVRDSAKSRLREWLRVQEDSNKEYTKLIQAQRGMTTKMIQRAHQDWIKSGRKSTWLTFLTTRRAEIDARGGLIIQGASLVGA